MIVFAIQYYTLVPLYYNFLSMQTLFWSLLTEIYSAFYLHAGF